MLISALNMYIICDGCIKCDGYVVRTSRLDDITAPICLTEEVLKNVENSEECMSCRTTLRSNDRMTVTGFTDPDQQRI